MMGTGRQEESDFLEMMLDRFSSFERKVRSAADISHSSTDFTGSPSDYTSRGLTQRPALRGESNGLGSQMA